MLTDPPPLEELLTVEAGDRYLVMLLEKVVRMIAGKCWDCVLAVLLQMVVGVAVDLQNCALDVGLV